MSFVLVSMVGLLPVGLEGMRASAYDTVRTQMVETVANRLRERPFGTLTSETFYFDQSGSLGSAGEAWFQVEVALGEETGAGVLDSGRFREVLLRVRPMHGGQQMVQMPIWLSDTGR